VRASDGQTISSGAKMSVSGRTSDVAPSSTLPTHHRHHPPRARVGDAASAE
jgi:hypothetical protein